MRKKYIGCQAGCIGFCSCPKRVLYKKIKRKKYNGPLDPNANGDRTNNTGRKRKL